MISIIVATYGDEQHWDKIAHAAMLSAYQQSPSFTQVIRVHGDSLHEARNAGAAKAYGDTLVFLDADDWLDPMFSVLASFAMKKHDVIQPKTRFVEAMGPSQQFNSTPTWLEPSSDEGLIGGNHLIVGCPIKREMFMDIGGFDDWPVYEDWALWLKAEKAGADFGKTKAVYNVLVNPIGRNQSPLGPETFHRIREQYL